MTAAQAQALIEKLQLLSEQELREIEGIVDSIRRRRAAAKSIPARLRKAVIEGKITPPSNPGVLSSARSFKPLKVPGRPLSEIVLEDRTW